MDTLRKLIAAAALCAFAIGFPVALIAQQGTGPIPTGTGTYGVTLGAQGSHVIFGGGLAPSLNAACGTSPGTVVGTDSAFHFVSGTGTSATCTITPSVLWTRRPTCSLDSETGAPAPAYQVATNGVITLSGVADSTRYHAICIGQPGG